MSDRLFIFMMLFVALMFFSCSEKRDVAVALPKVEQAIIEGDLDSLVAELSRDQSLSRLRCSDGKTLLMRAVESRNSSLVQAVLDAGGDPLEMSEAVLSSGLVYPYETALTLVECEIFMVLMTRERYEALSDHQREKIKEYIPYFHPDEQKKIVELISG